MRPVRRGAHCSVTFVVVCVWFRDAAEDLDTGCAGMTSSFAGPPMIRALAAGGASWEDGRLERGDDMQTEIIAVKNVKRAGCASAIQKNLSTLPGVERVEVNFPGGPVTVHGDHEEREADAKKLAEIGYPVVTP